jgi:type II secretion system protein N
LKAPILGIGELVMDQTNAEFSISRQSLRLKALTFEGPMLEGRINGTIDLRRPLEKSRLNLSGNVKPRPELVARLQETVTTETINPSVLGTRGMTFRVRGTIDSPDVPMR